ncbi:putative suppressor of mrs2-1 mutation [Staphylotrichum tortipilum]|uniref:Sorting nexin-4 n=1 Tax=Staphylotrichum tortipilum TaxID=2831512 RepID=A0AAN6MEA5_9PEZI|nr:putative suppressor of mrs2-1 mutation [Staphylotrichum longicolle]
MSASTRVARRALVVNPFMGTGASLLLPLYSCRALPKSALLATSIHLARNAQHLGPASALLIPIRTLTTQGTTSHAPPGAPPPGFNPEEAKKPLPREPASAAKPAVKAEQPKPAAAAEVKNAAADKATAGSSTEADAAAAQLTTQSESALEKAEAKKEEKKLTLGQKIKKEVQHYWDGTKLLAAEVKISSRLALKMAAGYELTRRENRQLQRTVQDLGRLVPFSVFVIVPFAELLLPVALKLFPNMLPSTYEGQKSRDKKASTLRATRREVSDFLRQTLKETGLPLTQATTQREEFTSFFRKLRSTGEKPTAEDVIRVCQIFKDDVTLDNLSRPQLVSMCRYLNLNTFGTDLMLRYQVRHRMRQIKRDDRAISYEGVDSLTVSELQIACAGRGIKSYGVSPARLREDMQTWLELRLRSGVPSTLLVLSNAYMYGQQQTPSDEGVSSQIEALTGVLSSIPEELFHEIELEVHNAEGAATNKQRLEVIKEQQELIDEELEQDQENQATGFASPRDTENIDDKEAAPVAEAAAAEADKAAADAARAEPQQPEAAQPKSSDNMSSPTNIRQSADRPATSCRVNLRPATPPELDFPASTLLPRPALNPAQPPPRPNTQPAHPSVDHEQSLPCAATSDPPNMAVIDQDNFSNISWHSEHTAEHPSAAGPSSMSAPPPPPHDSPTSSPDYPHDRVEDDRGRRSDERRRDVEVLECVVSEPHKENDGTKDAYVSYLITTNTTFSTFQRPTTTVRRRFTDFVFLYKVLVREYQGSAVPPLPDKQRMEYVRGDRFGPDFTARRAYSLQRFLSRLALHPVLRRAGILHTFLESHDWNATMRSRSGSIASAAAPAGGGGVFDSFADSFMNAFTKVHKPDRRFIEVKEKSDKLDEDLSHVEKVVARVARREADLETDLKDLAEQFQKLITLEPGVESAVHAFAASVEDTATGLKKLRDHTDQDYLSSLRDMVAYSAALKTLLRAREQKQLDYEQLTEYLSKSTADRDLLAAGHHGYATGPFSGGGALGGAGGFIRSKLEDVRGVDHEQARRDRLRKLELRVEELTGEVENARGDSERFAEQVVKEVAWFERVKRVEFKRQFEGLVRAHVEFYQGVEEVWEGYVREMEGDVGA